MKLIDVVIAWSPPTWPQKGDTRGEVRIGQVKGSDWKRSFVMTDGAVFAEWRSLSDTDREKRMFIIFNQIVVRDGIDPQTAHQAFLEIDEYRWLIPRDTPGAEDQPEE